MRNHDLISISEFRIPRVGGVKETHDKNDEIAKCETTTFRIPGVGGVKEGTHDRNSRYAKSQKDLDRRIIKIVDR
jgi:hypothetical protein